MKYRIAAALLLLSLFSCSKKELSKQDIESESNIKNSTISNHYSSIDFPFSFLPDEQISGNTRRLTYNATISDYAPIIKGLLTELSNEGGGTLLIAYGIYPLKSQMLFEKHDGSAFKIAIVGERSNTGAFPHLVDNEVNSLPHEFLSFQSNWTNPQMSVHLANLEISSNNIPYRSSHPFINGQYTPRPGVGLRNIASGKVVNLIIHDIYGSGIEFANFGANGYNGRIESPTVLNSKIINCWSANSQDDSGDGILFWGCYNPQVKSCIISNDVYKTNFYSRGGIVIENGSESALIQDNFVEGYRKNIHIECDLGGHTIDKNYFCRAARNGIVFAHKCGQLTVTNPSPTQITNNYFLYDQTFGEFGANHSSFISMEKADIMNGSIITGNTFWFSEQNSQPDRSGYINNTEPFNIYIQTHGQDLLTIANNIYN